MRVVDQRLLGRGERPLQDRHDQRRLVADQVAAPPCTPLSAVLGVDPADPARDLGSDMAVRHTVQSASLHTRVCVVDYIPMCVCTEILPRSRGIPYTPESGVYQTFRRAGQVRPTLGRRVF